MGVVAIVFRLIASVYDIVTFPVYMVIQQPWVRLRRQNTVWARQVSDDNASPMVRLTPDYAASSFKNIDTVDALFRQATVRHASKSCMGTRVVKKETREMEEGKSMVKYDMGEYRWKTFKEVESRVDAIGRGLLALGVAPKSRIVVFAETREEWMMTALACFRKCIIVCTIYATLGDEGIVHGVNETEVSVMITSEELLPRVQKLMPQLPKIKHVIYMPARGTSGTIPPLGSATVLPFETLLDSKPLADASPSSAVTPTSQDTVIIMYTSGSTGTPKGVVITNGNVVAFVLGIASVLKEFTSDDTFIGILPLAHVMEIAAECAFMSLGVRIGYSSPFTLTDSGTALMKGVPGDVAVLRPTVMIAVPLLLNRIRKGVEQAVGSKGAIARGLFEFAISYKTFWRLRGFSTPLVNRIVFKNTKQILGGRVKAIVSGSAPLSDDTQEFLTNCLDCPIVQGYGLTETTAGATLQDKDDVVVGVAGPPLNGVYIRLVDWDEGDYHVKDKPHPRGEIVVGGPTVTAGYYKRPDLTKESFEDDGTIRWFHTGDIGEFLPRGLLKIIDRKKDLVKLQYGEYVSLGKVETALKTHPLVDNVCVYGSSLSTFTIALVQPSEPALRAFAKTVGVKEDLPLNKLLEDPRVTGAAAIDFAAHCTKVGLVKFEIPLKYKLCKEAWTPETELVTAALKIRRIQIQKFYQQDINMMYKGVSDTGFSNKLPAVPAPPAAPAVKAQAPPPAAAPKPPPSQAVSRAVSQAPTQIASPSSPPGP